MSDRTSSASYLLAYAEGTIKADSVVRGLAENLFLGLKERAIEIDGDEDKNLATEFRLALAEMESKTLNLLIALTGKADATHAKDVTGYKNRKSELIKGLLNGIDPTKYDTFTAYRKATDEKTGGNASGGNNKGTDNTNSSNKATDTTAVTELQTVTNNVNAKIQDKLNLFVKHLAKLDEEQALSILQGAEGAIARLTKAGGRHSNAQKVANA